MTLEDYLDFTSDGVHVFSNDELLSLINRVAAKAWDRGQGSYGMNPYEVD